MGRFKFIVLFKIIPALANQLSPNKVLPQKLQVNNYFLNKYCDEIQSIIAPKRLFLRVNGHGKYRKLRNNLVMLCYYSNLIKMLVLLFKYDMSIDTRMILADWSMFIAIIPSYFIMAFLLSFILFIKVRCLFYPNINPNKDMFEWLKLFQMMRGELTPHKIGLNRSDTSIVKKFSIRAKLVFRLINYGLYNTCNYYNINCSFHPKYDYFI